MGNLNKLGFAAAISILLFGCSNTSQSGNKLFTRLCHHCYAVANQCCASEACISFIRDNATDIIYVEQGHNGMSVYYSSTGTPMKYDEFHKTHNQTYHRA